MEKNTDKVFVELLKEAAGKAFNRNSRKLIPTTFALIYFNQS